MREYILDDKEREEAGTELLDELFPGIRVTSLTSTDWDDQINEHEFISVTGSSGLEGQQSEYTEEDIESSSLFNPDIIKLNGLIDNLFYRAKAEEYEEGEESEFTLALEKVIKTYGNYALVNIGKIILSDQCDQEVKNKTLLKFGNISHNQTHTNRLRLLENCLDAPSSYTRDAASLGIASLDDPRSIPAIKAAIERENIPELREDLILVLEQLQDTKKCQ